jgi:hypothetical protein
VARRDGQSDLEGAEQLMDSIRSCNACGRLLPVAGCEWKTCPNRILQKPVAISEMSGAEFEDFVRTHLLRRGYLRVETTKKSGDFGADLIVHAGPDSSGSTKSNKNCNACGRLLPVAGCEWKTCPNPRRKTSPKKIVVQCKRSVSPVGISAVQEVLGARSHYGADEAWVVTDSTFTPAAQRLAKSARVRLKRILATLANRRDGDS